MSDAIHDWNRIAQELQADNERLATECKELRGRVLHLREHGTLVHGALIAELSSGQQDLRTRLDIAVDRVRALEDERDTWKARAEKAEEERNAALGAPNGCHRGGLLIEHIERQTAEQIAAFADTCSCSLAVLRSTEATYGARALKRFADDVRAQRWKREQIEMTVALAIEEAGKA